MRIRLVELCSGWRIWTCAEVCEQVAVLAVRQTWAEAMAKHLGLRCLDWRFVDRQAIETDSDRLA